jgi:hypothetical protein
MAGGVLGQLISGPRFLATRHVHACVTITEADMPKNAKEEAEWQRLDLQLDSELEATFPASDALKITRRQPDTLGKGEQPKVKGD